MRALVKHDSSPGAVGVQDVAEPALQPGQVLIEIAFAAICGTDRQALDGSHDFGVVPRILGHEASGIVRALAPDVDRADLAIGTRVTVETDAVICGRCEYCRGEQYNRCPNRRGIGTTADGAIAELLAMPQRAVHPLPDEVGLLEGALTEPLAIAVHAVVEQSPSLAGQVVVVIGPGAIGQLCAQVARAAGATVVLVGRSRHADALRRGAAAGARTVDAESEDLAAVIHELTGGLGAHTVFECSGAPETVDESAQLLRRGGRLVLVAFFRGAPPVDLELVINRELEIVGSRGKRPSSYRTALRLMSEGQVDVGSLVTAVLPLEQWEAGLGRVGGGEKVVFRIAADADDQLALAQPRVSSRA
ncbi:zinc-binding dehydrogenase [Schumannella soli]|nr:zinc-binding dehydrogenase [Schumannella soli]